MKRTLIGILTGLIIVAAGWIIYENRKSIWPLEDDLEVKVVAESTGCASTHPLWLSIKNNSRHVVTFVNVQVAVRQSGYSSELASENYITDKIISPGETHDICIVRPDEAMLNNIYPGPLSDRNFYNVVPASDLLYTTHVVYADSDL